MFGIGVMELIILGLICLVPVAAGIVILVVLLVKKNSAETRDHTDAQH